MARRGRSLDEFRVTVEDTPPAPSPADILAHKEQRERILLAIQRLPKRESEAMTLLAVEDLSYAEIAEALGCRSSTVRVLIARARQRLRKQLRIQTPSKNMEVCTR